MLNQMSVITAIGPGDSGLHEYQRIDHSVPWNDVNIVPVGQVVLQTIILIRQLQVFPMRRNG